MTAGASAERLLRALDDDYVLGVVEALAAIPSVSGEEDAISRWTAGELRRLDGGLAVEEQEVLPGRRNVIARLATGRPGPRLLFNGHLDTLPVAAGWRGDPFQPVRREGRLYGAEVNNMKAAVGAMIGCLAALLRRQEDLVGEVIFSGVIGECDALGLGTISMLERGLTADLAINGEPTDLNVMTAHSGVTQLRLTVQGRSVHVCRRAEGVNAIDKLVHLLPRLGESALRFAPHPDFPGLPTLNVGVLRGGSLPSMLADRAEALIDVRTVPGMSPESVKHDLEAAIAAAAAEDPQLRAEVALLAPPQFVQQHPFHVSPAEPVVEAVAAAHAALSGGARPRVGTLFPQVFYGTDASHLLRAGIPTAIYGPGKVEDINMPDESIAVADLLRAARVYALSALGLCRRGGPAGAA